MTEKMPFLDQVENKETFFRRVSCLFPTLDYRYKLIEEAYADAKDAFRGKKRESGERYFEHLRAVALILMEYLRIKDHELIIVALLHDIVEDCPDWTIDRVAVKYGERVALLVEWMSKPSVEEFDGDKNERNQMYHGRFESAPREFFLIKLSDRLHNLITMWKCTKDKKRRKIAETKEHYLPYAEKHLILLHELEYALKDLETE
ncbi:HD domain-containing protein [Candidatus Kaiserbacteria bacterium]|nr:MAG: HD domain-containing protein [Candidatus Kaiserbacteria bacterium]